MTQDPRLGDAAWVEPTLYDFVGVEPGATGDELAAAAVASRRGRIADVAVAAVVDALLDDRFRARYDQHLDGDTAALDDRPAPAAPGRWPWQRWQRRRAGRAEGRRIAADAAAQVRSGAFRDHFGDVDETARVTRYGAPVTSAREAAGPLRAAAARWDRAGLAPVDDVGDDALAAAVIGADMLCFATGAPSVAGTVCGGPSAALAVAALVVRAASGAGTEDWVTAEPVGTFDPAYLWPELPEASEKWWAWAAAWGSDPGAVLVTAAGDLATSSESRFAWLGAWVERDVSRREARRLPPLDR